jgi:alkylated DNA repair protein (DNA oxidative demethylase)
VDTAISNITQRLERDFRLCPRVIRELAISLAKETGNDDFYPECCLINLYRKGEKLGMHKDTTEENKNAPIISISLGDSGIFILGGLMRTDETKQYIV